MERHSLISMSGCAARTFTKFGLSKLEPREAKYDLGLTGKGFLWNTAYNFFSG